MSAPVDYARPIGWACPVCDMAQLCWLQLPPTSTTCAAGHKATPLIPVFLPLPKPKACKVEGFDVHEIGTFESDIETFGDEVNGDRFAIVGISNGHVRTMWPNNISRDIPSCVRWVATGKVGRWGKK